MLRIDENVGWTVEALRASPSPQREREGKPGTLHRHVAEGLVEHGVNSPPVSMPDTPAKTIHPAKLAGQWRCAALEFHYRGMR